MPILAAAFHFVFKPGVVRYRDQVTLLIYWAGHCFLFRALLIVCRVLFGLPKDAVSVIDAIAVNGYLAWALWRFHQGKTTRVLLKTLIAVAIVHLLSKGLFFLAAFLVALQGNGLSADCRCRKYNRKCFLGRKRIRLNQSTC